MHRRRQQKKTASSVVSLILSHLSFAILVFFHSVSSSIPLPLAKAICKCSMYQSNKAQKERVAKDFCAPLCHSVQSGDVIAINRFFFPFFFLYFHFHGQIQKFWMKQIEKVNLLGTLAWNTKHWWAFCVRLKMAELLGFPIWFVCCLESGRMAFVIKPHSVGFWLVQTPHQDDGNALNNKRRNTSQSQQIS